MDTKWLSIAFRGLTKEQREQFVSMENAVVAGYSNVFDERDALKARIAELEEVIEALRDQVAEAKAENTII